MSAIRFFTDEDVHGSIAAALRGAGFDAVSTPEIGRLRESNESQLLWAASQGYSIVTFNVGHFGGRHTEWLGNIMLGSSSRFNDPSATCCAVCCIWPTC